MDVLETLRSRFTPDLVGKVAGMAGIEISTAEIALSGALPALLGGFAAKANAGGVGGLETLLNNLPALGSTTEASEALDDPEKSTQVAATGHSMLDSLFGDKLDGVTTWLSTQFGLDKAKGVGFLAGLAPLVLGFVKNIAGGDLIGFLKGLAPSLSGTVPAGLGSVLGLSALGESAPVGERVETVRRDASAAVSDVLPDYTTPVPASSGVPAWLWAIPIIALLGWGVWTLTRPASTVEATQTVSPNAPGVRPEAPPVNPSGPPGPAPASTSGMTKELPGGISLSFAAGSVEDKLIAFVEDPTRPIDKTTWFTFDRLEFDTGKATIRPASMTRVEAIAKILNAYPNVKLKIGGYTDNVGDPAANLKLSQDRATETMKALTARGIAADRLEAEGYGEQHPVASNDSEDGRRQNRRIDVRVTEK